MRAPEQPSGWPIAIAPPFGLTIDGSSSGHSREARERLRGERLVELDQRPGRPADAGAVERRAAAATGPMPTACGSTPDAARHDTRQRLPPEPSRRARSPSSNAAAPSFIGDELPAVTVPSVAEHRLEPRQRLEGGIGADALVALEVGTRIGATTSRVEAPGVPRRGRPQMAASANSSCFSRVIAYLSARISAPSPSGDRPLRRHLAG